MVILKWQNYDLPPLFATCPSSLLGQRKCLYSPPSHCFYLPQSSIPIYFYASVVVCDWWMSSLYTVSSLRAGMWSLEGSGHLHMESPLQVFSEWVLCSFFLPLKNKNKQATTTKNTQLDSNLTVLQNPHQLCSDKNYWQHTLQCTLKRFSLACCVSFYNSLQSLIRKLKSPICYHFSHFLTEN